MILHRRREDYVALGLFEDSTDPSTIQVTQETEIVLNVASPEETFVPMVMVCDASLTWSIPDQQIYDEALQVQQETELSHRKKMIKVKIQERLDAFARSHPIYEFPHIDRAISYKDDPRPEFAAVGVYCLQERSNTWAAAEAIFEAVIAEQRPMPANYEEIESELPVLEWPQS